MFTYSYSVKWMAQNCSDDVRDARRGNLAAEKAKCHLEGLLLLTNFLNDLVWVKLYSPALVTHNLWSIGDYGHLSHRECLGELN